MKYKFILMFFVLIISTNNYGQDEQKIYCQILSEFVFNKKNFIANDSITLVLRDTPLYLSLLDDYTNLKINYKKLEKQTFDNFIQRRNQKIEKLDFINIRSDIIIIDNIQIADKREFLLKHPKWNLWILEFSKIGFNEQRNQALVYYGFETEAKTGGGVYIILKKKRNGKWKIKRKIPSWAS